MVAENHYRWDFIGLSTDTKPTPADSEKVTDGSTYYTSDDSKLYVWYKDQWYEKEVEGGGGGGTSYTAGDGIDITNHTISVDTDTIQEKLTAGTNITIDNNVISATGGGSVTPVQTTGTSTTDVMSQNATSSMVFADPGTDTKIKIGSNAYTTVGSNAVEIGTNSRASETDSIAIGKDSHSRSSNGGVAIGGNAGTYSYCGVALGSNSAVSAGDGGVAIGFGSGTQYKGGVALGAFSVNNAVGEVNVGSSNTAYGYDSTNYRLISGVHDPVNAHDAATKGYVDANAGGGVKTLTTADYNYPVNNPNGIAFWLLDEGQYKTDGQTSLKLYVENTSSLTTSEIYGLNVITKASTNCRGCYIYTAAGGETATHMVINIDINGNNSNSKLLPTYVTNTLTSSSTTNALSACQGKVLKDLIDALDARVTALEGA